MTILPLAYLPSVEYLSHVARDGAGCVIDLGEHYVKRSERNRARILTAGGVMELSVHLVRANRPRTPMRDVRIDYSKRWAHRHWQALVSAYASSPYFDHYAPRFEPLYLRRHEFLVDLNLALLETLCEALRLPLPALSERYVEASAGDADLRPKKRGAEFASAPYVQVFSDRMPFEPNLSTVDLLFCEGPRSLSLLAPNPR